MSALGRPRVHARVLASTNDRARDLAVAGAPHGTLVTAAEQTAGRGRQGRSWTAPAGGALLMSLVLRHWDGLLPLRAGLAVAEVAGPGALVKWPNDVLLGGRKLAGVLGEARPRDGWVVLGIGVNCTAAPPGLPAATLGRDPEPVLADLLAALEHRLADPDPLDALRARDALLGRPVHWDGGEGTGEGIAADGSLHVRTAEGEIAVLHAGEVHLGTPG